MKRIFILMSVLILFFSFGVSAYSNPASNWQAQQPTFDQLYAGDMATYWPILADMKDGQCEATTDFVIGIPPGGCSPSIVRSDLLAEQNVPVFCQLYAIKVNPLIKVSSIKSISFKGDYPEGVRSVVYHPARAAINSHTTLIGSETLENIGYVVIILEQEKVEANITERIFGNLTATMKYDVDEAYGTGRGDYYLESMGDDDWQSNYMASSFWNGRGFLRVTDVGNGGATIQVMGDREKVLKTLTLKEGETSASSYLPGFYCKAGLKVKLTDITTQEDMARLNIDGQTIWVRDNSKFLNDKCRVTNLNVRGNNDGDISISCSGTGAIKSLSLKGDVVSLREEEGRDTKEYNIGDGFGSGYIVAYGKLVKEDASFVVLASKMPTSMVLAGIESLRKSSESYAKFVESIKALKELSGAEFIASNDVRFVGMGIEVKDSTVKTPYFDKSVDVVEEELIEYYRSEEKENGETWAAEALYEEIVLAGQLGKLVTQKRLMDLFLNKYPLAKTADYVRDMREKMDGTDYSNSYASVYVGDEFKSISVVDFKAVSEGKKAVSLRIGNVVRNNLSEMEGTDFEDNGKDKSGGNGVILGDVGRVEIKSILPGKVQVYFRKDSKNKDKSVTSKGYWINEGESEVVAGISVYVDNININQVAHVSLIPDVKNDKSEAHFTFNIGVEKRAIELSPELAQNLLDDLNGTIRQWQKTVDKLGNVVKGLKGACFATSAVLMIKSMASGTGGAALARTKVMARYKVICDTEYSDMTRTQCYNELESDIEKDVVATTEVYVATNKIMEDVQAEHTADSGGIFGGKSVDPTYNKALTAKIGTEDIPVNLSAKNVILVPVTSISTTSQVQAILTWQNAVKNENANVIASAKADMDNALRNVALIKQTSDTNALAASSVEDSWGLKDINSGDIIVLTSEKTESYKWAGKTGNDFGAIVYKDMAAQVVSTTTATNYLVILNNPTASGNMNIHKVLSRAGNSWTVINTIPAELRNVVFIGSTSGSCSNAWPSGTAKVSYYEAGDNKGLPAIVPFDLVNGWYVKVSNSGGSYNDASPQGYTASADVSHSTICNIGTNRLMENGGGDDKCQTFNINTLGSVKSFGGCDVNVEKLYKCARQAIQEASAQSSKSSVNFKPCMNDNIVLSKGEPASIVGGFECQDFMSAGDCKLMFNVCDPVICPPSRCNLGGKFPVSDVIQTGVIGSLLLCLPNAKEGIYMPVCLSGVHAGLDAYLSILKSERDCLQHSLDTGELVGICDQITSIYKCEFFWRQMSPLMDQMIPGVIDYMIYGSRVRGGGEYAFVEQSYNTMKSSANYFTEVYAQNAFRAFNIRSVQEIGSTMCKAFVGTSAPGSADFIEDLLEPESPSQFYAQFSESLFTEATVPTTSQYKVYFHIYAGNNEGTQYKVYLKNPPATSYYANTPEVAVKSGYIAAGSSADESVDFTAPSGYKELCVVINAQEECGFKSVSTDFGVDWVQRKYIEEQAETEDIKSEKECISGTPSSLSMASLNLQSGLEESIDPEIALRGIVRICASTNPEAGVVSGSYVTCTKEDEKSPCGMGFKCSVDGQCVDKAGSGTIQKTGGKWRDVGYCGDASLRCWLDVDSVKDDLQVIADVTGASSRVLDSQKGLIENTRLGLEGVRVLLTSVKAKMKGLGFDDLKTTGTGLVNVDGLQVSTTIAGIIWALDNVTGTEDKAGAGTNGDRAEALFLKASVWRILSWYNMEEGVTQVVESRVKTVGKEEGSVVDVDCDSVCTGVSGAEYIGGDVVSTAADCGSDGVFYGNRCCCSKDIDLEDDETLNIEEDEEVELTADSLALLMSKDSSCDCGNNCGDYAESIFKYSNENGIDTPLRVLAIMIQESGCKYGVSNGGSYGLMQIEGGSFMEICNGKLSSGTDDFINMRINSAKTDQNIECGIKILKKKYNDYGEGVKSSWAWSSAFSDSVKACTETIPNYGNYREWQAAERGYNGWGCADGVNTGYVEDVENILTRLRGEIGSVSGVGSATDSGVKDVLRESGWSELETSLESLRGDFDFETTGLDEEGEEGVMIYLKQDKINSYILLRDNSVLLEGRYVQENVVKGSVDLVGLKKFLTDIGETEWKVNEEATMILIDSELYIKLTLYSALIKAKAFTDEEKAADYSDVPEVKAFIDSVCEQKVVGDEVCEDVKGGSLWDLEGNLNDVIEEMEKVRDEKRGDYDMNDIFNAKDMEECFSFFREGVCDGFKSPDYSDAVESEEIVIVGKDNEVEEKVEYVDSWLRFTDSLGETKEVKITEPIVVEKKAGGDSEINIKDVQESGVTDFVIRYTDAQGAEDFILVDESVVVKTVSAGGGDATSDTQISKEEEDRTECNARCSAIGNYYIDEKVGDVAGCSASGGVYDGTCCCFGWQDDPDDICKIKNGKEIIKVVGKIKEKSAYFNIDSEIQGEAKSLECLALMIAMKESRLRHCEVEDDSCFVCGEDGLYEGADANSYGIMQIDASLYGETLNDIDGIDENVMSAIEDNLIAKYQTYSKFEDSLSGCNGKKYGGWQAALRGYDGWNSDCSDAEYVENVLGYRDDIESMFVDVCGAGKGTAGGGTAVDIAYLEFAIKVIDDGMYRGKYSDNKIFVDQLKDRGFLGDEYNNIIGSYELGEKDMVFVKSILVEKLNSLKGEVIEDGLSEEEVRIQSKIDQNIKEIIKNTYVAADYRGTPEEEGKYYCALYVSLAFDFIFGEGRSYLIGVYGNAWDIPKNVIRMGGERIYDYAESGSEFEDYSSLKAGDIFGLKMVRSGFTLKALAAGESFTHVGLYLGEIDGEYMVAHKVGETVYTESIDRHGLFSLLGGVSRIETIMRPKQVNLRIPMEKYMEINKLEFVNHRVKSGEDLWGLAGEYMPDHNTNAVLWLIKAENVMRDNSLSGNVFVPRVKEEEVVVEEKEYVSSIVEEIKTVMIDGVTKAKVGDLPMVFEGVSFNTDLTFKVDSTCKIDYRQEREPKWYNFWQEAVFGDANLPDSGYIGKLEAGKDYLYHLYCVKEDGDKEMLDVAVSTKVSGAVVEEGGEEEVDVHVLPSEDKTSDELVNLISGAVSARRVDQPSAWAEAVVGAMQKAEIPLKGEYAAVILATIEGESSFKADPIISGGFDAIVKRKIESYWFGKQVAAWVFYNLNKKDLEKIETDGELEIFIDSFEEGKMRDFLEGLRPDSIGAMQVRVSIARGLSEGQYSDKDMRNKLYTMEGGVEYGVLNFKSIISRYSDGMTKDINLKDVGFIFADYNAGLGASVNAAFQAQLNKIMGTDLKEDGILGAGTRKVVADFLRKIGREDLIEEGVNLEIRSLVKERSGSSVDAQIPDITYGEIRFGRLLSVETYVERGLSRYNFYCEKLGC